MIFCEILHPPEPQAVRYLALCIRSQVESPQFAGGWAGSRHIGLRWVVDKRRSSLGFAILVLAMPDGTFQGTSIGDAAAGGVSLGAIAAWRQKTIA